MKSESPGCLGCDDLHAQFQSEVPPKLFLCEAEKATL